MPITITNANALQLLGIVSRNQANQANLLQQLSTGFKLNRGADDPAGLIAATSLSSELTSVGASIENNQRTDSILNVADGALGEIAGLIGEIEALVAESANQSGLSASELAANQSQIDSALSAIDQIVNSTNFNGMRLLDGTQSISVTGVAGNTNLSNVKVFSRSQSSSATALTITRTASAQTASAVVVAATTSTARTSGSSEVVITGTLGAASLTFASGLTKAQVVTQINTAKAQTGVSAIVTAGGAIQVDSTTYGTDAFVSVEVLSGGVINSTYGTSTGDGSTANDIASTAKTFGVDAGITINGQAAGVDGLDVSYNANGLSLSFSLSENFGKGNTVSPSTSFTVNASGGMTFQLGTNSSSRQTIGVDSAASFNLGGGDAGARLSELKSGGAADLDSDVATALLAVKKASSQIAELRGRVGGFQKFQVKPAINSLQTTQASLESARSLIRDTDYATATAQLNQQSILTQTSIQLLGLASQQTAQILSLLG